MSGPSPDKQEVHTVLSVMRGAEAWLLHRGVDAPQRSAELLLGKVLGLSRLQLYLAHDRPLDQAERDRMRALTARRGNGEPVAYLIGSWAFRSLELDVGPAVLIPRPETEQVVDAVLARAPQGVSVADLGTGSGAIAIALAVERPDLRVLATDVSKNALLVARANVVRHAVQARVELVLGSWWEAVPREARFHLVVSNPPYIDPEATARLAPDVKAWEPPLALFSAPRDVLSCYRAIVTGLERHLLPGGWFVAETGVGASDAGLALLRAQSFLSDAQLLQDHAGIDRVLVAKRTFE
ncbi:MAG TPA: peptide chain release factor N(5)-glutamine methyltransferase [Planctomycetota bacterium]|nr:peptide chain release factor N(5)-glutamine methyltransferase [Planctomycetota bacterium]